MKIFFDASKCTGCSICEIICSAVKFNEFNPRKSLIRIYSPLPDLENRRAVISEKCDFCGLCVEWCRDHALTIGDA